MSRYWLLLAIPIALACIPINKVLIADWTFPYTRSSLMRPLVRQPTRPVCSA